MYLYEMYLKFGFQMLKDRNGLFSCQLVHIIPREYLFHIW